MRIFYLFHVHSRLYCDRRTAKKHISGYKTRLVSNRSPRWVTAFMIKTCFIAITELPFKYGQFYEWGNPLI